MRTKKVIFNTFSALILQLITFIAGIILPRLIIVTYGSSVNGLRASLTQFICYLYIFEAGLNSSMIFSLYKPLAEKNYDMVNGILSAAKNAFRQVGVIFTVLLIALTVVYPLIINKEKLDLFTIILLTLSIGASGIINYFLIGSYTVLLSAAQLGYVLSIARSIYVVINTAIMVVLISFGMNIALVYFVSLTANLLNAFIINKYSKKKFPYLNFKVTPEMSALSKRNDAVVHQVSGMVAANVPILLLTIFADLKTVSIYAIYSMIFSGVGMLVGVLGNSFTATFGDLIASKEYKILKNAYSEYEFIYYGIISFVFSCVLILGMSFLKIYTAGITDVNYVDYSILLLFTVCGILTSWKVPQSTIIISAGHFKETKLRAIIETCLTILVSVPLVILFGLKGAIIGSAAGLLYRSIDLFYAEKITNVSVKYTLIRVLRMFSVIFLSVLPFNTIFIIRANNLIDWILYATIVAVWVGGITLIINYIFEKKIVVNIAKRLRFSK